MGVVYKIFGLCFAGATAYASYRGRVWTLNGRDSQTTLNHVRLALRPEIDYQKPKPEEIRKYMIAVLPTVYESSSSGSVAWFKHSWNNGVCRAFEYLSSVSYK